MRERRADGVQDRGPAGRRRPPRAPSRPPAFTPGRPRGLTWSRPGSKKTHEDAEEHEHRDEVEETFEDNGRRSPPERSGPRSAPAGTDGRTRRRAAGSTVLAAKPMTVVRNATRRRVGPIGRSRNCQRIARRRYVSPVITSSSASAHGFRLADLPPHLRQIGLPEEPAEERQRQAGHGQGLQVGAHQVRAAADSTITVAPSLWESESYCSFPALPSSACWSIS